MRLEVDIACRTLEKFEVSCSLLGCLRVLARTCLYLGLLLHPPLQSVRLLHKSSMSICFVLIGLRALLEHTLKLGESLLLACILVLETGILLSAFLKLGFMDCHAAA
jgi:hypothetical protein